MQISDENIKHINIEHIILSNQNNITINGLNKNIKKYMYMEMQISKIMISKNSI